VVTPKKGTGWIFLEDQSAHRAKYLSRSTRSVLFLCERSSLVNAKPDEDDEDHEDPP
jgi:hypothetical protein